jgi:tryptophan synthase alpha chain
MAGLSDGAIVGSAIVKIVEQYGKDAAGPVKKYVEEMVTAVRKA